MTNQLKPGSVIENFQDMVRGVGIAGASASGWAPAHAELVGMKAEESATGRVSSGESINTAIQTALLEAELVVALDVFSAALAELNDPKAAFDEVAAIKMVGTSDMPKADNVLNAARDSFATSLEKGLSPHAAVASAFITAGAIARMASAEAKGTA